MSIIDELVYDRTQRDVDRVFSLKNKILTQGLNALSSEEYAEYFGGMKGAYNYTDMNRVGRTAAYIADCMIEIANEVALYREEKGVSEDENTRMPYNPEDIAINPKTDWTMSDVPTQTEVAEYLENLALLRKQLPLPANVPSVPVSLDRLTYSVANDLEYLLYVIYQTLLEVEKATYERINHTVVYAHAGISYCGD